MGEVVDMAQARPEGVTVRNIMADGSRREKLRGCVERADQLPEPARRMIVHLGRLGGEEPDQGARSG